MQSVLSLCMQIRYHCGAHEEAGLNTWHSKIESIFPFNIF